MSVVFFSKENIIANSNTIKKLTISSQQKSLLTNILMSLKTHSSLTLSQSSSQNSLLIIIFLCFTCESDIMNETMTKLTWQYFFVPSTNSMTECTREIQQKKNLWDVWRKEWASKAKWEILFVYYSKNNLCHELSLSLTVTSCCVHQDFPFFLPLCKLYEMCEWGGMKFGVIEKFVPTEFPVHSLETF